MAVTIYGIKNCDTVKKARKWLDSNDVDYRFHDFRADGIDGKLLDTWFKQVDWQTFLNTRGTTWRKQPDSLKKDINRATARALMLDEPALIKRPVLVDNEQLHVGFSETAYAAIFSTSNP